MKFRTNDPQEIGATCIWVIRDTGKVPPSDVYKATKRLLKGSQDQRDKSLVLSYINKHLVENKELAKKIQERQKRLYKRNAIKENDKIRLIFDYEKEKGLLIKVKRNMSGFEWKNSYVYVDFTAKNVEKIVEFGFLVDIHIKNFINNLISQIKIDGLNKELFDYQKESIWYAERWGGRILIADEMGLGKTVQALAWTQLHKNLRPVVIVCPASVKYQWADEIIKWIPSPFVYVLEGRPKENVKLEDFVYHNGNKGNVYIIVNYDVLSDKSKVKKDSLTGEKITVLEKGTGWARIILKYKPKILIIDECQYIKNYSAYRSKATRYLGRYVPHVIALSGTPIVNRPIEFYSVLKLLKPYLFPSKKEYGIRYCNGRFNGFGWDYSGASNIRELHDILTANVMVRRRKIDVLKQLPSKRRITIPIDIDNRKEYVNAENDFIKWLSEVDPEAVSKALRAIALVKIERLKHIVANGKIKVAKEWIRDFLDSKDKLVIFCTHRSLIDALLKEFPLYGTSKKGISVCLTGEVSAKERQRYKSLFMENPDVRLFIGTIRVASEGLTLTSSHTVLMLELPWTPSALEQAEDRVHRIGQEENVDVYYLIARNTIEEQIIKLLSEKQNVVSSTLDGITKEDDLLNTVVSYYMNRSLNVVGQKR